MTARHRVAISLVALLVSIAWLVSTPGFGAGDPTSPPSPTVSPSPTLAPIEPVGTIALDPTAEPYHVPTIAEAKAWAEARLLEEYGGVSGRMVASRRAAERQWRCTDEIVYHESRWRVNADNPWSSAYGLPQANPGRKMASAGSDWAYNPITQLRWLLGDGRDVPDGYPRVSGYLFDRYGSPCNAAGFKFGWCHLRGQWLVAGVDVPHGVDGGAAYCRARGGSWLRGEGWY